MSSSNLYRSWLFCYFCRCTRNILSNNHASIMHFPALVKILQQCRRSKLIGSLRMLDGAVRRTAKQTVWNKWFYGNLVLYFLSYEFKIVSNGSTDRALTFRAILINAARKTIPVTAWNASVLYRTWKYAFCRCQHAEVGHRGEIYREETDTR
jgi:hypothetical protein